MIEKSLLLGASGFLGSYFQGILPNNSLLHTSSYQSLALHNKSGYIVKKIETDQDIELLFQQNEFTRVINCIALSGIEKCEENPELAIWLNSSVPLLLAQKCWKKGIQLVHISTDAVFSGEISFPSEVDKPCPISRYGKTKLMGEKGVVESNKSALICRVNFIGWNRRGNSLFNYFYFNLLENRQVKCYSDVYFTPLYAARTVELINELSSLQMTGIFHVVGSERITKYDFALMLLGKMSLDRSLLREEITHSSDFIKFRSKDLSLSNLKMLKLGLKLSPLSIQLDQLLAEMVEIHE